MRVKKVKVMKTFFFSQVPNLEEVANNKQQTLNIFFKNRYSNYFLIPFMNKK